MTNLTRRNFLLGSLGTVSVILIDGLVGCKNSEEAQTLSINPLIIDFIRTPPTFIRTCADECGNPIP